MVAGEGIASPTGRDIDGKYLDQNEQDLKTRYVKFQKDWPLFGITLMCDSWTGPTRMSDINFLKEYIQVVDDRLGDVFIGTYVGPGKHTRVIYF